MVVEIGLMLAQFDLNPNPAWGLTALDWFRYYIFITLVKKYIYKQNNLEITLSREIWNLLYFITELILTDEISVGLHFVAFRIIIFSQLNIHYQLPQLGFGPNCGPFKSELAHATALVMFYSSNFKALL